MARMNDVDLRGVTPGMSSGGVVPADMYKATITKSERKKTNRGDGELLLLTFTIQQGECKGRSVDLYLNLWNSSAQAREIANSEYAYLLSALGIPQGVQDSQDLHNIPVLVQVIVDEYTKINPKTRQSEVKKSNKIIDFGSARGGDMASAAEDVQPVDVQPINARPY